MFFFFSSPIPQILLLHLLLFLLLLLLLASLPHLLFPLLVIFVLNSLHWFLIEPSFLLLLLLIIIIIFPLSTYFHDDLLPAVQRWNSRMSMNKFLVNNTTPTLLRPPTTYVQNKPHICVKKAHISKIQPTVLKKKREVQIIPWNVFFCGKMIRGFCGRRWGGNKRHIKPTFKGGWGPHRRHSSSGLA